MIRNGLGIWARVAIRFYLGKRGAADQIEPDSDQTEPDTEENKKETTEEES